MYKTNTRSLHVLLAPIALLMIVVTPRQAAADTIYLAWDASSDSTVVGYMVHLGTQSGTYTQHIDVGLSTAYAWASAVAGQQYCFAVSAYASGNVQGPLSNEICGYSNRPPVLLNPGPRTSIQGQATSLQLQGSDPDGSAVTYSASGLPPGLTLMASTGFISGTPTTVGTYTVTATVSDGVLRTSQVFTWTISAQTSTADTTPPSVTITAPTSASSFTTTTSSIGIGGTAGDNIGVAQVRWVNDRGGSGIASGTTNWTVAAVALQTGTNTITVTALDAAGNSATDVITVSYSALTSPTSGSGSGTGLRGDYYSGTSFGTLVTTRTDPTVDFAWGTAAPAPNVPADSFSVRWTGEVAAPVTGTYTFSTVSDDGVRLWIGNNLIIDNWTDHAPTTNTSGGVALTAGQRYAVRLEFYDRTGGATMRLQWTIPGQATQAIPQTALYSSGSITLTSGTGLRGDYYSGATFGSLVTTRTDPTVNFQWGTGAPAPNVQADDFSVRWTGEIAAPATATYTFTTVSDDGVRLWIGSQLVIDNWTDHALTTNTSVGVALQGGQRYPVRLEYYDRTGGATIQLQWAYSGTATQVIPQSVLYPSSTTTSSTTTAPVAAPGLRGDYYSGTSFTALVTTRTDLTVDFAWGLGAPAPNVPADDFSVRWTGAITAPVTGIYTFSTVSDDGVRLWIGNQLVIDNWTDHASTTNTSGGVALTAGQRYAVRLEYYDRTGGATMRLQWTIPGQATQVIPSSALSN